MKLVAAALIPLFALPSASGSPVVIFHGMGDSCCSDGMRRLQHEVELSGQFVHSIRIGDSPRSDMFASFFDDLNRQVDEICSQLAGIPMLSDGFHAIGFSQAGQILRAYVQRCNAPPVRNLITVGSQHGGVSHLPKCQSQSDAAYYCSLWDRVASWGLYTPLVQRHLVQAQYFRDPGRIDDYLENNRFLRDINNEGKLKKHHYAEKLCQLENFVMFMFAEDSQVVPRESSWFAFNQDGKLLELEDTRLYQEDWIGLAKLAQKGGLHRHLLPGEHMQIPADFVQTYLAKWLN